MKMNLIKIIAKKLYRQRVLLASDLYTKSQFSKINGDSELAGKTNSHFLKQTVYDTMKDGSKLINFSNINIFNEVGDFDEKPEW